MVNKNDWHTSKSTDAEVCIFLKGSISLEKLIEIILKIVENSQTEHSVHPCHEEITHFSLIYTVIHFDCFTTVVNNIS